jgi:spermidine/putrescine transport system substrate-binding protein
VKRQLHRCSVLALLVLIVGLILAPLAPPASSQGTLRLLNWKGYGSDEVWAIKTFEDRYHVKIVHDYFNSEDELLTKLRTSPGVYSAVLPNSAYYASAIQENLIQPIDTSQLKNYADIASPLKSMAELNNGGKVYGVPWTWGATAMAYNTQKVPGGIDSINAYWDPRFKTSVGWWDDFLNSIQFAAIALGQDPNSPSDLTAIKQKLQALRPQIKTFWTSEDQFNKLFASGQFTVGVYWSGSAARAGKRYNLPLRFVIPKEGAIGWVDAWAIPAKAPNAAMGLKWIDYMTSSEFYVPWDTKAGAPPSANLKAVAALPASAFNRKVMGDPTVAKRLIFMKNISDDQRKQYIKVWEEVKASFTR